MDVDVGDPWRERAPTALARDLHDRVVQELIGVGWQLQRLEASERDEERLLTISACLDRLDTTVRRLRAMIFQNQETPAAHDRLSQAVAVVAAQAGRALGHDPVVHVGAAADVVPAGIADEVLAVLQEALSNVLRHADAGRVDIRVAVLERSLLVLVVDDDGVGVDDHAVSGNGTANMRRRAQLLGGSCTLTVRDPRGTRLRWAVPIGCPLS